MHHIIEKEKLIVFMVLSKNNNEMWSVQSTGSACCGLADLPAAGAAPATAVCV